MKVKLNSITHDIPSSWMELKTKHYIKIVTEWDTDKDIADRDYFKLLNIFVDGKFSGLEQTAENQVTLINTVGWVVTEPFEFSKELPKVLEYKGRLIDIPEHPSELSIGQNIHLRRDYIDKSKTLMENIAIAVAIYLQPKIDNSLFKIARAQEIAKDLEEMPVHVIYPIGFFLLNRALRFGMRPEKPLQQVKTNLRKRLEKMWLGWLKFKDLTRLTTYL